MTDQIPADKVREIIAAHRDGASRRAGVILAALEALLPTPPRPTLADMNEEERRACKRAQADVAGEAIRPVIINPFWADGAARIMWPGAFVEEIEWGRVTPRPDLPRMEWPGEAPVPPNTLAVGSAWDDADALARACEESGRDQIVVLDHAGNAYVWDEMAEWWEGSAPPLFAPYTIIHEGKKAHQ